MEWRHIPSLASREQGEDRDLSVYCEGGHLWASGPGQIGGGFCELCLAASLCPSGILVKAGVLPLAHVQ